MSISVWDPRLTAPVSPDRDYIRGPSDAPVTLLEYGDYECPYCGAAHPVVKAVCAQMGPDLRFVYRHFPLTTIHPHAQRAAEAAEAAGAQGQFWAMHDVLFENQQRLDEPYLLGYARALGLELDRFTRDLAEHSHLPKIREDFMSGVYSGVNGTPTFFINGARHDGALDLESLLAAVQNTAAEAARMGA